MQSGACSTSSRNSPAPTQSCLSADRQLESPHFWRLWADECGADTRVCRAETRLGAPLPFAGTRPAIIPGPLDQPAFTGIPASRSTRSRWRLARRCGVSARVMTTPGRRVAGWHARRSRSGEKQVDWLMGCRQLQVFGRQTGLLCEDLHGRGAKSGYRASRDVRGFGATCRPDV
jgi:hypothetical protein